MRYGWIFRGLLRSFILVAIGLVAAGCTAVQPAQQPPADAGVPPKAEPRPGGTLRFTYSTPFLGMDPHRLTASGSVTFNSWVYPYLFYQPVGSGTDDNDYSTLPYAAESWKQENDTTYLVQLRKGIKWPDKPPLNGREMTAEDVKYSYDRLLRMSPYAPQFPLKSVDVVDRYNIRFSLKEPYAPWVQRMASEPAFLLPREIEEQYGDFTKPETALGNGPFRIKSYQVGIGSKFVFERNPDFFMKDDAGRTLPYVDQADWINMTDTAAILTALRTGQLDFANVPWPSVASIKATNPEIQWLQFWGASPGSGIVRIRTDQKPFSDIRVRRAISMAINREEFIQKFFLGEGKPYAMIATGAMKGFDYPPEKFFGEQFKWMRYNLDEAKRLMAEAGYPDGFDAPTLYSATFMGPIYLSYAEWVVGQLAKIGIKAKVQADEYAKYQTSTLVGEYKGLSFNPTHPYQDPDDWLYLHFYPGAPFDATKINDSKLNELIMAQRKEMSPEKRSKLVLEAETRIAELVPMVNLGLGQAIWGVQPWVKNFRPYTMKMTHGNHGVGIMRVWLEGSPTQKP